MTCKELTQVEEDIKHLLMPYNVYLCVLHKVLTDDRDSAINLLNVLICQRQKRNLLNGEREGVSE